VFKRKEKEQTILGGGVKLPAGSNNRTWRRGFSSTCNRIESDIFDDGSRTWKMGKAVLSVWMPIRCARGFKPAREPWPVLTKGERQWGKRLTSLQGKEGKKRETVGDRGQT